MPVTQSHLTVAVDQTVTTSITSDSGSFLARINSLHHNYRLCFLYIILFLAEYMCVNERQDNSSGTVKMQGEEVAKVEDFKHLGSTVQSNGECGR